MRLSNRRSNSLGRIWRGEEEIEKLSAKSIVLSQKGSTPIGGAAPVNGEAAEGELTISGVVIEGETATIGDEVYEFTAGGDLTSASNIDVDLSSAPTLEFAQATLTMTAIPTADDTMLIDEVTYTWKAEATAEGEIEIGNDLPASQAACCAAMAGDALNDPHPTVTTGEWSGENTLVLTAITGGVAGNAYDSVYTGDTNAFDAATFGTTAAGVDATNLEAAGVLETVINEQSSLVTASEDAGVVTATAKIKGEEANSIALLDDMVNGDWDNTDLAGGVWGTVGEKGETFINGQYIYFAVDTNTIADNNWRRASIGTAY